MKKIFNTFTEISEPLTFLILTDYGNFVCQSIFISLLFTKKNLCTNLCIYSVIYIEPNGSPVCDWLFTYDPYRSSDGPCLPSEAV